MSSYFSKPLPLAKFVLARAADINDRIDAVEAAFDAVEAAVGNSLTATDSFGGQVPNAATRANKTLVFNGSGVPSVADYLSSSDVATAVAAASTATTKAGEASASASAASASASTATTKAGEASASAISASSSADTATTKAGEASASAGTATTKAGEASASAGAASGSASAADASADAAALSEANALVSKNNADAAALLAQAWAVQAEDDDLVAYPGQFSALHWAAKAADSAAAAATFVPSDYIAKAGGTMTGALAFIGGSVSAPGLGVSGDTNTGIYASAADTLDFAAGGVRGFQVSSVVSAVNYLTVAPSATGAEPGLSAAGSDTDIDIKLTPKGAGKVDVSAMVLANRYSTVEYDAGNSGTTKTIDCSNGQNQKLTLTGTCSATLSNIYAGMTMKLRVITGSSYGLTFTNTIKWAGGTVYTPTTATGEDFVLIYSPDGTLLRAQHIKGWA